MVLACSPPSTTSEEGTPAPRAVAPDPERGGVACQPGSDQGVWARFEGQACAWELADDGDGLVLSSLAPSGASPARGAMPEPCRSTTCVYDGVLTSAGPLILAVVPSYESEMPSDVWLGFVDGERLLFTSLWEDAGESVESDYTWVGPAHALAPFVCGDALALLTVARIDATGVVVPDALRAREGWLDSTDASSLASDEGARLEAAPSRANPGTVERSGCVAVDLPVP
ncbi:hypothetical protein [Paraliomyxa miuraensis]|uniref:hypothetical protein n=1 Tax=Paraliomyxa miuraensis TaxID=376150 RepID=UPI0022545A37|nr:hypothetical protein [Paraliomyxa miuraensis]